MRSMQKRETQRKLTILAAVIFVCALLIWAFVSLVSPDAPAPQTPALQCVAGQSASCAAGGAATNQTAVIGPGCPGCCCLAGLLPSGGCGCA